ncbi:MAG: aspartate kinase, partial [Flavobacteriaceae bacterium]|nr:aspartate kinase [Flavobacteriaceae bacterium]
MRIFKFGGASVKDAEGVRNLLDILRLTGHDDTLVVVSAMGKTTNALEVVITNYFNNKKELKSSLQDVRKYHNAILLDLFDSENALNTHPVYKIVSSHFDELDNFFEHNRSPDYNFVYDQVVGFGELVSTSIVSAYLEQEGIPNNWVDVREFIKTDSYYRHARVD